MRVFLSWFCILLVRCCKIVKQEKNVLKILLRDVINIRTQESFVRTFYIHSLNRLTSNEKVVPSVLQNPKQPPPRQKVENNRKWTYGTVV